MKASLTVALLAAAVAEAACPLPANGYKWKDSGSLAKPGHGWTGIKDYSVVPVNGKHLVLGSYTTTSGSYSSFQFDPVSNWTDLKSANQNQMNTQTVAPNTFYFTPKKIWVTGQEWGAVSFSYSTSSDPTNPSGWSGLQPLYNGGTPGSSTGAPLDPAMISDGTNMWLFFAGDDGHVYRTSMPIGSFPSEFPAATSILSDSISNLFEAVQIYKVAGVQQYLLIVECLGSVGRYFRSFTATSLGGTFTAQSGLETSPFAGASNSGSTWSNDISSGDLIRSVNDETMQIDGCNLQLLYQGLPIGSNGISYNLLPWQPGLLTLTNPAANQGTKRENKFAA